MSSRPAPPEDAFTFERHYDRYDRKDGTTAWYERLAIGFEYDEQLQGRLSALDWDEHHCRWSDEYEFQSGEMGAWTCDSDTQTLAALRDRGILVPEDADNIPIHAEAHELAGSPVERECRKCRAEKIISTTEIELVYPSQSTPMQIATHESTAATHFCRGCETLFEFVGTVRETDTAKRETDGGLTLAGAM